MKISITDLEKYNLLGYDRELRKFIIEFVDKYYPLTSSDIACVLEGKETAKTIERKYIRNLLMQIKDDIMLGELEIRKVDSSYKNDTMNYEVKKSLEFKRLMVEKLKEKYDVKTIKKR